MYKSKKEQWIAACEETLREYKNNCHPHTKNHCKLCLLINCNKQHKNHLPVQCIFGTCHYNNTFPCCKMETYRANNTNTERIRFYEILIPILKSLNEKEFHKRTKFKNIIKLCWEIDEIVHTAFEAKNNNHG